MPAPYWPLPTELVHSYSPFHNGNHRLSSSCITKERTTVQFQWTWRMQTSIYSHPSQVQEVSPVSFHGENTPISSTPIWDLSSSLCFHQGGEALPSNRNVPTCIPRRLAPTFDLPVMVPSSAGAVIMDSFESGICPKLGQIGAHSQSKLSFSGCLLQSGEGYDRSLLR